LLSLQAQQKRHLQENTAEDNTDDDEEEEEIDECHHNNDKRQHINGNHDYGANDNDTNLGGEGYKNDAVAAIFNNADTTAELGSGTAAHNNESHTSSLYLSSNGYDVEIRKESPPQP
jgi:hypothetical protein